MDLHCDKSTCHNEILLD